MKNKWAEPMPPHTLCLTDPRSHRQEWNLMAGRCQNYMRWHNYVSYQLKGNWSMIQTQLLFHYFWTLQPVLKFSMFVSTLLFWFHAEEFAISKNGTKGQYYGLSTLTNSYKFFFETCLPWRPWNLRWGILLMQLYEIKWLWKKAILIQHTFKILLNL